uniref:C-JID domain-containing protein n=1 Tax=Quercus lobata TaxID=97700 RepID=A0A7N2LDY6_QUELO
MLFLYDHYEGPGTLNQCLPQSEIPGRFKSENIARSSSVTIQLPLNLYDNLEWMGFAFCAVFSFQKHPTSVPMKLSGSDGSRGTSGHYSYEQFYKTAALDRYNNRSIFNQCILQCEISEWFSHDSLPSDLSPKLIDQPETDETEIQLGQSDLLENQEEVD